MIVNNKNEGRKITYINLKISMKLELNFYPLNTKKKKYI